MSYGRTPGPSADIPVTVFTSVLTSAFVTLGILFYTDNLIRKDSTEDEPTKKPVEDNVTAPSLKGLTAEVAAEVLRGRNLRLVVQDERPDDGVPKGKILAQDPLAGSELKADGAISVVISTGSDSSEIPDVIGKTKAEAERLIRTAGFAIGEIEENDTGTPGTVFATIPPKGDKAKPGTKIKLTITKSVKVPKVVGKYLPQAKKEIENAGLKVGKLRWGDTGAKDSHVILKQKPEPETVVVPGSEVILTVNSD